VHRTDNLSVLVVDEEPAVLAVVDRVHRDAGSAGRGAIRLRPRSDSYA